MNMKYCMECGEKLIKRQCGDEGMVDYCEKCETFRFPVFNSGISAVVFNKEKDKILLIQQYGRHNNILVAGYINKGENAAETLKREVMEEVSLEVTDYLYNDSSYFSRTETLMHNFLCSVSSMDFRIKEGEVDKAQWFTIEEAKKAIMPDSLASEFLFKALDKLEKFK